MAARRAFILIERARVRVAAYVYGDILVLAAMLSADLDDRGGWNGVITVIVTTITTYLAHIVAHAVGERMGRATGEAAPHIMAELRDAVPILSAGALPTVFLTLAALQVIPQTLGLVLGAASVVVRLAAIKVVVTRLVEDDVRAAPIFVGLGLAIAAAVVVLLKVFLLH